MSSKKKCTYHTVTLRQQGESQTALKSITVPFHWKYCRIMCSHMELASEKGKQTKPFPFRKWSEVPLRKPAAPVHCQVVTPAVLKPVCVVLRRNYHCSDRTHARTHELTRAVRAFGDQPTEDQCARSQVDTHTHTQSYSNVSTFYSRDFAHHSDLHIHSLSIGVAHGGDAILHRHNQWRCNIAKT
jgi:hypothetical protein